MQSQRTRSRRRAAWLASVAFVALPCSALAEASAQVSEVEVVAKRADSYAVPQTTTATKIRAPARDVPQTIDVVPAKLLRDQRALSLQDALKNVPGVGFSSGDGQRDQVSIRGFSAIADQFVDGFRDDALYFRDLSNIDRVEVLKGPASVLYGRGSSGGLINRVTKKPGANGASFAASYGSYDDVRFEGDVARTAYGGKLAARLTGAWEDSDSYRNQQFLERSALAGSVLLKPTERTSLLLQADTLRDRRLTDFGIPSYRGRPVDVDPSTYYGAANAKEVDVSQSRVSTATAVLTHELGGGWTLRNAARWYQYNLERRNTLPGTVNEAAQTVSLNRSNIYRAEHGWFDQLELSGEVRAIATHQLLLGAEFGQQTKDAYFLTRNNIAVVNLFNPVNPVLPKVISGAPSTNNRGLFDTRAVYVQDLLSFGPHWKALVGARFDSFDQQTLQRLPGQPSVARTDDVWSPRVGVVWQPTGEQAYYVSWSRSFQPSGEAFALATNNADIGPEETENREVGAKLDLFQGRLKTTASLFELTRSGIKATDPATNRLIAIGTQRTRGLELSGTLDLPSGWRAVAGYAYLDAVVTKSVAVDFGQRVQGKRATITPEHSANLWITRDFGGLWGLGGGLNYVGDRFANPGNTVTLPSYVTADAMVWRRFGPVTAQVNVYNLADERYIVSGHGTNPNLNLPGAPRSVMLTLRYAL